MLSPVIQALALASLLPVVSAAKCQHLTITVPMTAPQLNFTIEHPQSDIDVTNLLLDLTRRGHDYGAEITHMCVEDEQCIKFKEEFFNVDATFCHPNDGPGKAIQILTSGLEWDRTYWDPSHDDFSYSYVGFANDQNDFATLTWDGLDQDPKNTLDGFTVSAFLEVEALHYLTTIVRNGSIEAIDKYDKIIHVGHGWGSESLFDLAALYPEDADAIVLTGFLKTSDLMTCLPHSLDPSAFVLDEQPGWITHNSYRALQSMYFSPEHLDVEMLDVARQALRPIPMGELFTHFMKKNTSENDYSGPVLTVVGQRDALYCAGDCLNNGRVETGQLQAYMNQHFKRSQDLELYVVPGGGHALNFVSPRETVPTQGTFIYLTIYVGASSPGYLYPYLPIPLSPRVQLKCPCN